MPTLQALDDAMLRSGRSVPAVNRLGGGTIAMAGSEQPWRIIGTSNVVYQLRQPTGRVMALRCPRAEPSELDPTMADRYRLLGSDPGLAGLRAMSGSPLVGSISHIAEGVLFPAPDFRSVAHPIVALEWVMGPTLLNAVDRACRADDRPYLATLSRAWLLAIGALATARFSHGDLTASNAVVRPEGGIALVDYDTSAWPNSPPTGPLPFRPGYSHPSGDLPTDYERRDDFSALVIYTSLRVLSLWPSLRTEVIESEEPHGTTLLFSGRDLDNPGSSALFARLRVLDDLGVRTLLDTLAALARDPVEATPPLVQIATEANKAARSSPPTPVPARAPRSSHRALSSSGYASAPATWPAKPTWPPAPSQPDLPASRAIPPPPTPIREAPSPRQEPPTRQSRPRQPEPAVAMEVAARERQRQLTQLNSLLLAGDEDEAQQFWQSSGLQDDPVAVSELGPRMEEIERRRLLRRTRAAAEAGDSTGLLQLWDEGRFDSYRPATPLMPMVEAARRRSHSVERLAAALDSGDVATVTRLWPELRGDSIASDLALRATRVVSEHLGEGIAGAIARGDDNAIAAAVRDAESAGVAIDMDARRAARAAAARAETRRALNAALEEDDRETLAALALSGRLDDLGALEPHVNHAVLRALSWPTLERALALDDDIAILAAYDAELFDGPDAMTDEQRLRVQLARQRVLWVETVRGALRRRDMATLWEAVQAVPPGAEARLSRVERTRIERLAAREEAVAALAVALRDGPDDAIVEAMKQVEAAGAALPETLDWGAVRGVADRISLAEAIREETESDTPDYARVARLLAAVRAAEEAGEIGTDEDDFARLEAGMLRAAHVARLRDALAANDEAMIAAAADPDPYGAVARLSDSQRDRVQRVLERQGSRRS